MNYAGIADAILDGLLPILKGLPAVASYCNSCCPSRSSPMEMADEVSKLDKMAKGTGLKWRVSVADMLAVPKIDNRLANRKELAAKQGARRNISSPIIRR